MEVLENAGKFWALQVWHYRRNVKESIWETFTHENFMSLTQFAKKTANR